MMTMVLVRPLCTTTIPPLPSATNPHWLKTQRPAEVPPAALPSKVDVAVIGSGISGVSTAYHVARRRPDLKVCVLDARNVSGGATGRNGGLVHPASLWELPVLAKEHGSITYALQYYILEHATRKALRELDKQLPGERTLEHDVDKIMLFQEDQAMYAKLGLGLAPLGRVIYAFKSLLRPFGLQIWDETECREQMRLRGDEGVVGAVCVPRSTDTVNASEIVTRLLDEAVENHGVTLCPYTHVEEVTREGETLVISTSEGRLEAAHVVYATNAWTPRIVPELEGKIVPARNHVVCFEPSAPLCNDGRRAGFGGLGNNYWVQRPDGRVICGGFRHLVGGGEEGIDDDAELSSEIMESELGPRHFLESKFDLRQAGGSRAPAIEAEWSGIIANSSDGIPFVGPLGAERPGEYVVAGFSGHGMTTALLCGEAVADMITGAERPGLMDPTRVCYGAMSPEGRMGRGAASRGA